VSMSGAVMGWCVCVGQLVHSCKFSCKTTTAYMQLKHWYLQACCRK
jgi:hypothetical protein